MQGRKGGLVYDVSIFVKKWLRALQRQDSRARAGGKVFTVSLARWYGSVYRVFERREERLRTSGSTRARQPRAGDGRTGGGPPPDPTEGGGAAPLSYSGRGHGGD